MAFDFGAGEVGILPNLRGFFSSLISQVRPLLTQAGTEGGQSLTAGLQKSFGNLGNVARIGFGAIGVAAIAEIGHSIHVFEQVAGEVRKLSLELGVSAQDASKLRFAAGELGISTDQLSTSFGAFSKHLVDGGKAFEKYGITLDGAHGKQKSFDELLGEVADKFRSLPKGPRQAAFAMDLFGRSGKALIPLLQQGRAGLAGLSKEAERLGLVLSPKDVEAAHKAALAHQELHFAIQGLQVELGRDYLPVQELATHALIGFTKVLHAIPAPIRSLLAGIVGLGGILVSLSPLLQGAAAAMELFAKVSLRALLSAGPWIVFLVTLTAEITSLGQASREHAQNVANFLSVLRSGTKSIKDARLELESYMAVNPMPDFLREEVRRSFAEAVQQYRDLSSHGFTPVRRSVDSVTGSIEGSIRAVLQATGTWKGWHQQVVQDARVVAQERSSLERLGLSFGDAHKAMREMASGNKKTTAQGKKDWASFQASVRQSYAQWRTDTASQLNFVSGALGDFADKNHVDAQKIANDFKRQLHSMEEFGHSLEQILQRSHGRAKTLTEALIQMGPSGVGAARAIAGANKKTFDSIVGSWNRAEGASNKLAGTLERQIVGSLKGILSALDAIARKLVPGFKVRVDTRQARVAVQSILDDLHRLPPTVFTTVILRRGGGLPHAQHGGDVTEEGLARVGERGEETVWLPAGAKVLPLSLKDALSTGGGHSRGRPGPMGRMELGGRIVVDWRRGVGELEAELDRAYAARGE